MNPQQQKRLIAEISKVVEGEVIGQDSEPYKHHGDGIELGIRDAKARNVLRQAQRSKWLEVRGDK